jgi:hypothetical protein
MSRFDASLTVTMWSAPSAMPRSVARMRRFTSSVV